MNDKRTEAKEARRKLRIRRFLAEGRVPEPVRTRLRGVDRGIDGRDPGRKDSPGTGENGPGKAPVGTDLARDR